MQVFTGVCPILEWFGMIVMNVQLFMTVLCYVVVMHILITHAYHKYGTIRLYYLCNGRLRQNIVF